MTSTDAPSPLAEKLAALVDSVPVKGPKCKVRLMLETLPEKDSDALRAILDNPAVSSTDIARTLNSAGHRMTAQNLQRHRRRGDGGGCVCP